MLVLQLFQIQLVHLPENQQLPVQELHLLLDRLTVGELTKTEEQAVTDPTAQLAGGPGASQEHSGWARGRSATPAVPTP